MSARKQGGQLRAILIRKLKASGLSEEMVAVLQRRKQVYTGTLSQAILKRDLGKNLRISYKINKDLDIIENVVINFVNRVSEPYYAEFVEQTLGANPTKKIKANPREIESWIFSKIKNGTWRSRTGDYIANNNYSTRKEKRDFNKGARGGRSKTYFYSLVGGEKSKKARASLAFVIARSINETQRLKNRSPFLVNQKVNLLAEFAIISGLNEFNGIWLSDLTSKSVERVISIFQ
jgi:hypothetical protein